MKIPIHIPKRGIKIVGATHCDPEDPTNLLCTLVCGSASSARQALYRRYATSWFEYYLRCDAAYAPWVYGTQVQSDLSAGLITYDVAPDPPAPQPCGPPAPPGAVQGLVVSRNLDELTLTWVPTIVAPPVTAYRIYSSASPDLGDAVLAGETPGASFTEPLAASPSPAHFKVSAVNAGGEGPR